MSTGLLDKLKLDDWFMVVIYVSSVAILISLFVETLFITNKQALLIFGGLWLFSLGEWKQHKTFENFVPQSAYNPSMVVKQKKRVVDIVGLILNIIGVLSLLFGINDLLHII